MENVLIKHNLIIYNNNPAGFIKNQLATVDNIFKNNELGQWLEEEGLATKWQDGVFEKLALNRKFYETELAEPLKNVRILQLKPDFDYEGRFLSFENMVTKYGELDSSNYIEVYDGELETNDLEEIYTIFNIKHPEEFKGHSLSMSDVVELYDEIGSSYHYVDKYGFREFQFNKIEQEQVQEQDQVQERGIEM